MAGGFDHSKRGVVRPGRPPREQAIYAEGANYRIILEGGHVHCSVWLRPDLTREQGQACALDKIQHLVGLAARPRPLARALVFDLTGAPETWGPVTHEALGRIVRAWEAAARPVIVVSGPSAIRRLTLRRLVAEAARCHGVVVTTLDEASSHLK